MNTVIPESVASPFEWWSSQRLNFNAFLVGAAAISFVCLLAVVGLLGERLPCLEVTAFTIVGGAIGFTIGLCIANVFYFLGPLSEKLIDPKNPHLLRRILFFSGTGFSVLLIFLPVIGNLLLAFFGSGAPAVCE
ncbi:MAG: hypothetical protein O9341_24840 [Paucibacter sp.]|nr:hypothetical protein [Roseateles sp.]